jgi:hypothetical protein
LYFSQSTWWIHNSPFWQWYQLGLGSCSDPQCAHKV